MLSTLSALLVQTHDWPGAIIVPVIDVQNRKNLFLCGGRFAIHRSKLSNWTGLAGRL
jgi:hypothetical protein